MQHFKIKKNTQWKSGNYRTTLNNFQVFCCQSFTLFSKATTFPFIFKYFPVAFSFTYKSIHTYLSRLGFETNEISSINIDEAKPMNVKTVTRQCCRCFYDWLIDVYIHMCVCVCVCEWARARARFLVSDYVILKLSSNVLFCTKFMYNVRNGMTNGKLIITEAIV